MSLLMKHFLAFPIKKQAYPCKYIFISVSVSTEQISEVIMLGKKVYVICLCSPRLLFKKILAIYNFINNVCM